MKEHVEPMPKLAAATVTCRLRVKTLAGKRLSPKPNDFSTNRTRDARPNDSR